jgi:uncharacterized protein (TIGR02600 family)
VESLTQRRRRQEYGRRSAALLLVLACMALLTIMIVALFLSLSSEVHTSKLYASDSSVKLLSQTAVNLVEAEIYQATSSTNGPCWASQPGMIRTYDANGNPYQYFKLYSDAAMTGTGTFDHTATANLVPDGNNGTTSWYNQKGVYVDLNQPLNVGGTNQYPIVDGDLGANDLATGFSYDGGTTLPTLMTPAPASSKVTVYQPLYNNSAGVSTPQVSGFWVNSNAPISPSSPNQIPMPVKWLYVLQNGSIAVPDTDSSATSTVTFTQSSAKPMATNQIVGRVAFWTDDETGKVNINTASEGAYNTTTSPYATSFNDTPRVCTPYDLNLAQCPAYQNEFQRYPGHPATVSLSTVFGNLTTVNTGTLATSYPENIYSLTSSTNIAPRTSGGGSLEATGTYSTTGTAVLPLLGNRLFATSDELLLHPDRTLTSPVIDQSALRRAQFFITANSRAPDVNLFNFPRVCIWPITIAPPGSTNPATTYQTAFDQLIKFCTTIAGQPYYFQRSDWTSSTEWSTPARNQTLLNYLQYFCGQLVPGFGGSTFAAKYSATNAAKGTELNQIFMEIFDYIRSTNIYDSSLTKGDQYNPMFANLTAAKTYGSGEVVPSYNSTTDTKGIGRYPTLSKAGILFIATADDTHQQLIGYNTALLSNIYGPAVPTNKVRVQAVLLFQMFDPAQGYTVLVPDCQIKVLNSTLTWNMSQTGQTTSNGSSPMFPSISGTFTAMYPSGGTASSTVAWGGNLGLLPIINAYFQGKTTSQIPTSSTATSTPSDPIPDFSTSGPIMFTGSVEAQVLTSPASGAQLVQDITFNFPADSISTAPTYIPPSPAYVNGSVTTYAYMSNLSSPYTSSTLNYVGRLAANTLSTYNTQPNLFHLFITSKDIMQDVQSVSGDLRLIAAHQTIPSTSTLFGAHPLWGSQFAHSFVDGYGMPQYGATRGQLVSGVTSYWSSASSSIALASPFTLSPTSSPSNDGYYISQSSTTINPIQTCEPEGFGSNTTAPAQGVTSGTLTSWSSGKPPGDFDNGFGAVRDGPYINKADEGGLLASSSYVPFFMDSGEAYLATGTSYFSPAREMPSAVMFGSLPTGVIGNKPWQTLLFHPDPTGLHAGSASPKDHLLLDLFTMPVVEPYAISEPLSTAGRINMNYLIVPFTYINRDTGLRAVLESQQMLSIPNSDSGSVSTNTLTYKQMRNDSHQANLVTAVANAPKLRFNINLDETLKGFAQRFYPKAFSASSAVPPDIFRSPSEICTLDLVPNDTGAAFGASTMQTYWQSHLLTGDNSRERPYANIYPLLTTKSNTFTIHYRVQSLQPLQAANAAPTIWREGTDVVTSEYRGSQTIERYIDPSALSSLPDYAADASAGTIANDTPLSNYYRFRVVSTRQFSP